MRNLKGQALTALVGMLLVGSATAGCHEYYRIKCKTLQQECMASAPPGTSPTAYCNAIYYDCLADAGCS